VSPGALASLAVVVVTTSAIATPPSAPQGTARTSSLAPTRANRAGPDRRLLAAARRIDAAGVAKLLALGANPNAHDEERTPALQLVFADLMYDTAGDAVRIVRSLLAAGANPYGRTPAGRTALMEASASPLPEGAAIVAALLAAGADPNARDARGWTALMCAAQADAASVAKSVLAAGADPTVRARSGETALSLAHRAPEQATLPLLRAALASRRAASRHPRPKR